MALLGCGVFMPAVAQDLMAGPVVQQAASAVSTQEPRVAVSIPAQPLIGALRAFGLQTQSQVLFQEAWLAGRQTAAVYGAYTPQEALELLLARTGLSIASVRARAFTLKVAAAQTSGALPVIAIY